MTYEELRNQYPVFVYHGFDVTEEEDGFRVVYRFETEGLTQFRPCWVWQKEGFDPSDETLREFLFSIGMVELVSYWKAACPPTVRVECGWLSEEQKQWWKRLYFNGLGEFFYTNGITPDFDSFMTLTARDASFRRTVRVKEGLTGCMVPVGGGKDSIVSLHILSQCTDMAENRCFMMNHRNSALASALLAGICPEHVCRPLRYLDRAIVRLNGEGFLNGHTPLSALIAFAASFQAYLCGRRYVVLSNESSANEASVAGSSVNHQYSKSFAFEKDFADYLAAYLPCGVTYFSLLRPLSELQIAAVFAGLKEYHPVFRSCNAGNAGRNIDTWCQHCSKCLFVTMILSPFLDDNALREIFRVNLLDSSDEKMTGYFEQLIGLHESKPFECVGSVDEINVAMCLAIRKRQTAGEPLPRLLDYYARTAAYVKYKDSLNPYIAYFDEVNLIPDKMKECVRRSAAACRW